MSDATPKCPKEQPLCDRCGTPKKALRLLGIPVYWACPLDPKDCRIAALEKQAAESEAQVKALTAELEEADKGLLFWRGIPAYTLDMTYDEAMSSKAVEAALARQKARAALKGESHD